MPVLSLAAKNTMLDALSIATLSLHSAYSTSGGNELAGGSPAYARVAVTVAAAAAGMRVLTGGPYLFDVPAATLSWLGLWTAGGVFLGMTPNAGTSPRPFAVDDLGADTLKSAAHGFVLNDTVVVWAGSAGALPGGLAEGTIYFVVTPTTNTLQLAATLGGSAIALSLEGNGFLQRITSVVYAAQGTFSVPTFSIDATVAT